MLAIIVKQIKKPKLTHKVIDSWRKMIKSLFVVILVCETIAAWNLAPLNIANDTSIIHVSVYYGRAFLCLENDRDLYAPTLIEATWPENALGIKPKVFPNDKVHQRRQGKCRGIQKARATDVDPKGRLWLIDNGSDSCHPKLSIYDLLYMNEEVNTEEKIICYNNKM